MIQKKDYSIKTTQRGFTLIELLIVIAIIGILASIVLVSLSGAKKRASTVKALSVARSLTTAMEVCADGDDFDDLVLRTPDDMTAGGGYVCTNCTTGNCPQWPPLSDGWKYGYMMEGIPIVSFGACTAFLELDHDTIQKCIQCSDFDLDGPGNNFNGSVRCFIKDPPCGISCA